MATKSELQKQEKAETTKRLDRLDYLMGAIIVVLLVGFVTMFIAVFGIFRDNESASQATYQNLVNQVQTQNAQIQVLTNQVRNSTVTPK